MLSKMWLVVVLSSSTCIYADLPNNNPANNMKFKLYEKMMGLYKSPDYYKVRKDVDNPDKTNTVLGKDLNKDGIRDDVENYINKTYSKTNQNQAAKQLARSIQRYLTVNTKNREQAKLASQYNMRAITCAYDYFPMGDTPKGTNLASDIYVITVNTYQRSYAMDLMDNALDGSVTTLPEKDYCDF